MLLIDFTRSCSADRPKAVRAAHAGAGRLRRRQLTRTLSAIGFDPEPTETIDGQLNTAEFLLPLTRTVLPRRRDCPAEASAVTAA